MDQQFQAKRRSKRARNRPKHAIGGISSGAKALGTGLLSGVEGLAMRPLEGAEREGVGGFLKGVGKGIAGYVLQEDSTDNRLATKPVVGMFDFASNVSEGVRNTTTLFDRDPLDRCRRPRFIAKDGVIRPYNAFEGTFLILQANISRWSICIASSERRQILSRKLCLPLRPPRQRKNRGLNL
jgi:vacuolar protein sorting-associated protein 13A/C